MLVKRHAIAYTGVRLGLTSSRNATTPAPVNSGLGVMLFLLILELAHTTGKIIIDSRPLYQSLGTEAIYSDGNVAIIPPLGIEACGIYSGFIGIWSIELERCTSPLDLDVKFGDVNQIAISPERSHFGDKTVTIVEAHLLPAPRYGGLQYLWALAATYGQLTPKDEYPLQAWAADGRFYERLNDDPNNNIFAWRSNAEFSINQWDGVVCIDRYLDCLKAPIQVQLKDFIILARGSGKKLIIVGEHQLPFDTQKVEDLDRYLPKPDTQVSPRVIGVTPQSLAIGSLFSRQMSIYGYPDSIVGLLQSFQKPTRRRKRGIAGLGLALSNRAYLKQLRESAEKGFAAIDENQKELQQAVNQGQENLKIIGETLSQQAEAHLTDFRISQKITKTFNRDLDLYFELNEKANALEDLILLGLQAFSALPQNLEIEISIIKNQTLQDYPNCRILSGLQTSYYYTMILLCDESFFTGDIPLDCTNDYCYLHGQVYHWRNPGYIEQIQTPVIQLDSCGIFFNTTNPDELQDLNALTTIYDALKFIQTKGLSHGYVLLQPCVPGFIQNAYPAITQFKNGIEEKGFKLDRVVDEYYSVTCPDQVASSLCEQMYRVQDFKQEVSELTLTNFTKNSSAELVHSVIKVYNDSAQIGNKFGKTVVHGIANVAKIPYDVVRGVVDGNSYIDVTDPIHIIVIVLLCIDILLCIIVFSQLKRLARRYNVPLVPRVIRQGIHNIRVHGHILGPRTEANSLAIDDRPTPRGYSGPSQTTYT